jgi:hypothetical protein
MTGVGSLRVGAAGCSLLQTVGQGAGGDCAEWQEPQTEGIK